METVTIQTATEDTDGYNNPTLDWSDPDETDVAGAMVEPVDSSEVGPGQVGREVLRVYLPAGTVVDRLDRLVVRERPCEVLGAPKVWAGSPGGVVVDVAPVVGSDAAVGS